VHWKYIRIKKENAVKNSFSPKKCLTVQTGENYIAKQTQVVAFFISAMSATIPTLASGESAVATNSPAAHHLKKTHSKINSCLHHWEFSCAWSFATIADICAARQYRRIGGKAPLSPWRRAGRPRSTRQSASWSWPLSLWKRYWRKHNACGSGADLVHWWE